MESITPKLSLEDRMKIHSERVTEKIRFLLEGTDNDISHMIHVSCTGYTSPSPLQVGLGELSKNHIKTTHMYHQGCYAAFPTIRLAAALANSDGEAVRVLHSELCSLHVQPSVSQAEQIIVQGLFGDGYCAYSVENKKAFLQSNRELGPCLEVLDILEERFPESSRLMTWDLHNTGFVMTLDKRIPSILAESIELLLAKMCSSCDLDIDFIKSQAVFAIHPGGPKIIDLVAEALALSRWQIEHSRSVLYDHGNISSATVPHILKRIVEEPEVNSGTIVISFGFGPGLTFFGGIFKKL